MSPSSLSRGSPRLHTSANRLDSRSVNGLRPTSQTTALRIRNQSAADVISHSKSPGLIFGIDLGRCRRRGPFLLTVDELANAFGIIVRESARGALGIVVLFVHALNGRPLFFGASLSRNGTAFRLHFRRTGSSPLSSKAALQHLGIDDSRIEGAGRHSAGKFLRRAAVKPSMAHFVA